MAGIWAWADAKPCTSHQWMGWDLHERPRHHAAPGSVTFARYVVGLHQKAYALAQPGSPWGGRTSASCELKAGDCVRVVLSPRSPIPPARRAPRGASAPDTWAGVSQSAGSIGTCAQRTLCARISGNLPKSGRICPLLCVDSVLKEKTFHGINKNRVWLGGSEEDKCQMCKTKGALVLKADQLQKWIGFAFQILLRIPRIGGAVCTYTTLFLSAFSSFSCWQKKSPSLQLEKQEDPYVSCG